MVDFEGTARFAVLRRLGEGGMGIVYEAHDREQGLRVALKCLNASAAASLLQLKDEFRALRDVHHPNLVSLGELVEADGRWFFTMELVEGTDLLGYLRPGDAASMPYASALPTEHLTGDPTGQVTHGPDAHMGRSPPLTVPMLPAPPGFEAARVRSTMAQLALGLQVLHDAGKIHRDIKPSNLLVTQRGRLVISDFGLVTKPVMFDARPEAPGVAIGTPAYMAPELLRSRLLAPASDWFSVGVVLYEVLVGWQPFQGTVAAMQHQKLGGLTVPPRALVRVDDDLDALCMALLAADPAQRPDGREVLARLGVDVPDPRHPTRLPRASSTRQVFVGRDAELEILLDIMRRADAGPGELVVLQGESGVGKTSLSRRFVEQVLAAYPSALVLSGRCHERESVPYKAFDGVMDDLTRQLREVRPAELEALLPANAGALVQLFPVLAQLPSVRAAGEPAYQGPNATERRTQLFRTVRALFTTLSARWPLVVLIDDLQWADADSLLLLRELMRAPTPPITVLATVRAGDDEPWWPEGGPHLLGARVHHQRLRPLPVASARELVRRLAAAVGETREIDADAIAAGAGGHPMFIQELLFHMVRGDGQARAIALDEALYARASQLSSDARELLALVALVGTPIPNDVLRDAAEMTADRFAAAATELHQERLTRSTGLRRTDATEPFHDRISETVRAHLEPDARRTLHARLARALGEAQAADAELVAIHWQGAGKPAAAYQYALRAAREADAALAFMRSMRLYRYCLSLLGDDDAHRTGELLEKLAEATANSGRSVDGAVLYLQAAGHFEGLRASALRRLACEKLLQSGHFEEGLRELATLLGDTGQTLPTARWKVLASTLTERARLHLRGYEPRPRDPASVTPAQLHEAELLWSATAGLGLIDTMLSAGFSARHLRRALDIGDPPRLVRGLTSEYALQAGLAGHETPTTREIMTIARTLADGTPELETQCDVMQASVVFVHGADFRQARALALRCEQYYLAHGAYRDELNAARHFVNASMWYLGDWSQLAERVTSQLTQALEREDLLASTSLVSGSLSSVWLFRDEPALAEEHLDAQLARWPRDRFLVVHFYELYAQAQLDLYRDDPARACERLALGWRALQRSFLLRLPIIRYMMHDVRARAALGVASRATGRERKALIARARRDREVIAGTGMCFADAVVHTLDASLAALAGDHERSLEQWARAAAGYDAHGLRLHAAAVRSRAARAQGHAPDAAEAPLRAEQVVAPAKVLRLLTAEV